MTGELGWFKFDRERGGCFEGGYRLQGSSWRITVVEAREWASMGLPAPQVAQRVSGNGHVGMLRWFC